MGRPDDRAARVNRSLNLRWIPWTLAVLPLLTFHLCHWISWRSAIVPACVPYWQGCISLSAAGRYTPANHLFDVVMTPMGLLLGLFWLLQAYWMAVTEGRSRLGAVVRYCGVVAGVAMVMYAVFLGVESPEGRLFRRLGINGYFLFNGVAQGACLWWWRQRKAVPAALRSNLTALYGAMLFVGFLSLAENALPADINAIDNIIEWHFAGFMSAQFAVMALLWKHSGWALAGRRPE